MPASPLVEFGRLLVQENLQRPEHRGFPRIIRPDERCKVAGLEFDFLDASEIRDDDVADFHGL